MWVFLSLDLEWQILYVGSASNKTHDQILDSVLVGPVSAGRHKFVFQAEAPNTCKIPPEDAVGVTVILLTCSYKGCEFVRVGYYVNNEYNDPELTETPPLKPIFEKVFILILIEVHHLYHCLFIFSYRGISLPQVPE